MRESEIKKITTNFNDKNRFQALTLKIARIFTRSLLNNKALWGMVPELEVRPASDLVRYSRGVRFSPNKIRKVKSPRAEP